MLCSTLCIPRNVGLHSIDSRCQLAAAGEQNKGIWEIHFWIGSFAQTDKKASAAMNAVNLRNHLKSTASTKVAHPCYCGTLMSSSARRRARSRTNLWHSSSSPSASHMVWALARSSTEPFSPHIEHSLTGRRHRKRVFRDGGCRTGAATVSGHVHAAARTAAAAHRPGQPGLRAHVCWTSAGHAD